jgi:NADPH2:quinone reductase
MKAVVLKSLGGPERLETVELPMPKPAADEIIIKVSWAGVNFIDVSMRTGAYGQSRTYPSQLPMTLGMEGAGTVEAVGEGVTDVAVGQPVAYCLARGSYAQYARVPAWRVVPVPLMVKPRLLKSL